MPVRLLVPDRVTIATWPPLLRPYSAVWLPVRTLNSASASGFVRSGEKLPPPALVSLLSMPSSVKFHDAVARAVHVHAAAGVRARDDAGLGEDEVERIAAAAAEDRQAFDRALIERGAEIARGFGLDDLGADALTSTVSSMPPGSSIAFMVVGFTDATALPVEANRLNPCSSTATV